MITKIINGNIIQQLEYKKKIVIKVSNESINKVYLKSIIIKHNL